MSEYPLISKLPLYVLDKGGIDYVHAEDLEQLLQNATVVHGSIVKHKDEYEWAQDFNQGDTHKALLLAIEPIEQKKVTITRADLEKVVARGIREKVEADDVLGFLVKELGL